MPLLGRTMAFAITAYLVYRAFIKDRTISKSPQTEAVETPSHAVLPLLSLTTVLATGWATLVIYAGLFAAIGTRATVTTWLMLVVNLLVAWAVMERWRWGRWALLGIAGTLFMDAACAACRLASGQGLVVLQAAQRTEFVVRLLEAYGYGLGFGVAILSLSVLTVVWLAGPKVHVEFEYRKRARTRRWQFAIAALLTVVYAYSLVNNGMSSGVSDLLAAKEDRQTAAGEDALTKEVRMASRLPAYQTGGNE